MKKIAHTNSPYQGFRPYTGQHGSPRARAQSPAIAKDDISIEGTVRKQVDALSADIQGLRGWVGDAGEVSERKASVRSQVEALSERLRAQIEKGVPGAEECAVEFNQTLIFASNAEMKQRREMWLNKSVPLLEPTTLIRGFVSELPVGDLRQCVALALRNHRLRSGIKANANFVTNPHQARAAIAFIAHGYTVSNNDYLGGLGGIQTAAQADVSVALCDNGYMARGKRLFDDVAKVRTEQQARIAIGFINNQESNPVSRAVDILAVAD